MGLISYTEKKSNIFSIFPDISMIISSSIQFPDNSRFLRFSRSMAIRKEKFLIGNMVHTTS